MSTEQDRPALEVDSDVLAVVAFLQTHVAASRLVAVADGLAAIAPLLWGKYQPESVQVIQLATKPIAVPRTLTAASE